jgi:hypothetical protein
MLVPRAMVRRAEGLILTVVLTIIGGITMPPPTGHLVALGVRIAKGVPCPLGWRGLLLMTSHLPVHQDVIAYFFVTNPMELKCVAHPFNSDAPETWFVPSREQGRDKTPKLINQLQIA